MEEKEAASSISIKQDKPEKFESNLEPVKDFAERSSRDEECNLKNNKGSVNIKRDGQINISSGIDSQFKMSSNGTIESISFTNSVKANTMKLDVDDLIISNHKFNRKIVDLADFKQVLEKDYTTDVKIAGGLTMFGTVLVRAWDDQLKRYVLIRRLANIPVFSPSLGSTDVLPGLQITPNTQRVKEMQDAYNKSGMDIESYVKAVRNNNKKSASSSTSNNTKKSFTLNKDTNLNETSTTTAATTNQPKSMTEVLTHQVSR